MFRPNCPHGTYWLWFCPFEISEVASSERFAEDSENAEKKDSDSGSDDIDHDTGKNHEEDMEGEEEEEVEEDNHGYSADFALFEMVPTVESMFSVDDVLSRESIPSKRFHGFNRLLIWKN